MKFSQHPNQALRVRPAQRCYHLQRSGEPLEIESADQQVGKSAKILCCKFSKVMMQSLKSERWEQIILLAYQFDTLLRRLAMRQHCLRLRA